MTVVLLGRIRSDRLSRRPHRRTVHRVRLHARRRGDRFGGHRADALADDVLAAAASRIARTSKTGRAASSGSSTRASSRLRGWYQRRLERSLELHARHRRVRRARAREHRASVSQRQERARAAGGSGLHGRTADLRARCDAAAKAPVRRPRRTRSSRAEHGIQNVFQIEAPGQSIRRADTAPDHAARRRDAGIQQPAAATQFRGGRRRSWCSSCPRSPALRGLPVQFVIKTTEPALRLNEVSRAFLDEVNKSGMFLFFDTDLKYDLPQSVIEIDRDKAAQLGLTMSQVGSSLGSLLGGGYVNYFSMQTRSYKVIPQVQRVSRLNVAISCSTIRSRTSAACPCPCRPIARIRTETVPETLNHFQQLNSATLSGVASPGLSQAETLDYLRRSRRAHSALRIHHRLRRSVAPVRPGIDRRHRQRSASPSSSRFSRWRRSTRAFAIRSSS